MIRVMMTIPLQQHFNRHAQKSRSLPRTGSALHHPRRRGVPEHVRRHIGPETRIRDNVSERLFDRVHRLPIPLHREALPTPFPATQVRQQLTRQRHWRLALIRLTLPGWSPIEDTAVNIDPSSSNDPLECCSANGARSRAGVEPHQNEFGDVPAAAPIGLPALLYFAVTPRRPN